MDIRTVRRWARRRLRVKVRRKKKKKRGKGERGMLVLALVKYEQHLSERPSSLPSTERRALHPLRHPWRMERAKARPERKQMLQTLRPLTGRSLETVQQPTRRALRALPPDSSPRRHDRTPSRNYAPLYPTRI
jgi:hypothetical protein